MILTHSHHACTVDFVTGFLFLVCTSPQELMLSRIGKNWRYEFMLLIS